MISMKTCYNKQKDVVMKKLKFLLLSFVLIPCIFLFAACDNGEPYDLTIEEVYSIVQERGYDGSFDEFIESIKGEDGKGIESVEKVSSTDETDVYAIVFSDSSVVNFTITNGKDGNGISAISKTNSSYAQDGRLVNEYTILYTNGETYTFVVSDGLNGENGVGIASIIKTNSEGNIDTYTITLTNGNETSFTITNGIDGEDGVGIKTIAKTSTDGLTDIYTITYTDETFTTFTVTNGKDGQDGKDGNGIKSISKTSTDGLTDTYTITLTDGSTTTFTVTNGKDGEDGRGIKVIAKTSSNGLIDTYTITYTDGTTSTFTVTNGEDGIDGVDGEDGLSAYEIYISYFPEYNKSEKEWIIDLINGNLQTVEPKTYTVTFDSNGGSDVPSQSGIIYAGKATKPEDPVKDGYIFDGWWIEGEKWSFVGYSVTEDITLVAHWVNESYNITYDLDGGKLDITNPSSYTVNDSILLNNPTKEGYNFVGWQEDGKDDINKEMVIIAGSTGDKHFNAVWETIQYSISYELDGGYLVVENKENYTIEDETFVLNNPTKNGHKFIGWTLNDSTTKLQTVTITKGTTGNLNFTAHWEIIPELSDFEISNETTIIGVKDKNATSIVVPEGVKKIGTEAFKDLYALQEITLPSTLEQISSMAFKGCSSLSKINIASVESWFNIIFEDEYSNPIAYARSLTLNNNIITEITIGNEIKEINNYALFNCSSIEKITIGSGLTKIGSYAFSGCSITELVVPNTVIEIEEAAFAFCEDLISLSLPFVGRSINETEGSEYANFGYVVDSMRGYSDIIINTITQNITKVSITGELAKIPNNAFKDCKTLETIILPETVYVIGESAFQNCSSLKNVNIPTNVTTIGSQAFGSCTSLEQIIVPISVRNINLAAFGLCDNLTIYAECESLPETWQSISCTIYFYKEEMPVDEGNYWHYVDGIVTIW